MLEESDSQRQEREKSKVAVRRGKTRGRKKVPSRQGNREDKGK